MMCNHEWVFIMGKSHISGHIGQYERVHWCWKCGDIHISMAQSNYPEKHYKVGQKPKKED